MAPLNDNPPPAYPPAPGPTVGEYLAISARRMVDALAGEPKHLELQQAWGELKRAVEFVEGTPPGRSTGTYTPQGDLILAKATHGLSFEDPIPAPTVTPEPAPTPAQTRVTGRVPIPTGTGTGTRI